MQVILSLNGLSRANLAYPSAPSFMCSRVRNAVCSFISSSFRGKRFWITEFLMVFLTLVVGRDTAVSVTCCWLSSFLDSWNRRSVIVCWSFLCSASRTSTLVRSLCISSAAALDEQLFFSCLFMYSLRVKDLWQYLHWYPSSL